MGRFRRRSTRAWSDGRCWRWILVLLGFAVVHDLGLTPFDTAAAVEPVAEAPEAAAIPVEPGAVPVAGAPEHADGHPAHPVAPLLLGIVIILLVAKVGGDLFERIGMPAVLGELVVGVVLGNMLFLTEGAAWLFTGEANGWHGLEFLEPDHPTGATLAMLAQIGVILLLFEVGLEARLAEMLSVGKSSLLVAMLGVAAPMFLGWLSGRMILPGPAASPDATFWAWLFPEGQWQVHVFIGATLCATSVGITARVLKDLGRSQQRESRIILGAAVLDDVLGLLMLTIVAGIIVRGVVNVPELMGIVGLAVAFLAGALVLGALHFPRTLFKAASFLRGHGLLVATALVICFGFSYVAHLMGLETIVGAFAAGLILEGAHYREVGLKRWENRSLEEALAPLTALLVPIFFVQMGVQVKLAAFADPSIWLLAVTITVMAILGKQVCALGVREPGVNRLAVGLGMIPRGEVGLIFADVGRTLGVILPGVYSAIVVMVMFTTMVTPPLLKWSLTRKGRPTPEPAGEPHPHSKPAPGS